jgi:putative ABC transport system permease protein
MSQGVLGPELKKYFPEVIHATRIAFARTNVTAQTKDNFEEMVLAVDPSFFSMFTIPFKSKSGLKGTIQPADIFLSESAAAKLFGKKDPVGEPVSIGGLGEFQVAAIFKDFPFATHIHCDFIVSFANIERTQPLAASWESNNYYNYVLLPEGHDAEAFNKKLNDFISRHIPASWTSYQYYLQPLTEVHGDDSYIGNPFSSPGKTMLISLVTVGMIILLLACFNYMNMATARSTRRAVEVGIRKVMGAYRLQLIGQFMAESVILVVISFSLGILWADLSLPAFEAFMGPQLQLTMHSYFNDYRMATTLLISVAVVSLVAGSYPSFFLSRFVPVMVLKGKQVSDSSRRLRRALVSLQFTLTGIFIVVAIVVFRQADYLKSRDLGFDKENLAVVVATPPVDISLESFKSELLKTPGVKSVCSSSSLPGAKKLETTDVRVAGAPAESNIKTTWLSADHDYVTTLGLKLLAGRNFLANGMDIGRSVILNERAIGVLGWTPEQAIGKKLAGLTFSDSIPGVVVGVVADYNAAALRRKIANLMIVCGADHKRFLARIEGGDQQVTEKMTEIVNRFDSSNTTPVMTFGEYMESLYVAETKIGQLLTFFTILAITIGALGLYALSAYEGEQRMKELGIRKILGASSTQLLLMLSRNFLRPVLVALVISMPLAFLVANLWLRTYPYRMSWSITIFLEATLCMFVLGWIAIVSQGIKASTLNPADTLRHE